MNMDSPVSRHHPLGHNWCPANPSWDQLLSKKGKQIYFLLFQEIDVVVVECWFMFQPNIYFRISDRAADTNKLSDLQIHVPDTQKPCPEQLGSWQSTAKKKEIFTVVQEKNIFFINNLLLLSFHNKSLALLLGRWKITTFQKGQTQRFFFGQNWIVRNVGEMFCRMGTIRWVIRTWRRPRTE